MSTTVSYTANPVDSRCQWWAVKIPAGFVQRIDLGDTASMRPLGFLKKGADLELEEGESVLSSEALHHRKARGFQVELRTVISGSLRVLRPDADMKARIKAAATPDQWAKLKAGSGDVAACLRALMALEMFDEAQFRIAFPKTAEVKYGPVSAEVAA